MSRTRAMPLRVGNADADLADHSLASVATRPTDDTVPRGVARSRGSFEALDWRQAVGGGLIALGMIGIVVAWFGVSGTLDPGEQMPYISSGGFGGSALIAIGVTLLVSFEHTRDRDALAEVLAELDDLKRRIDARTGDDVTGNGRSA